ncbi:MAG: type 4a pilus biogenesis protein PilO [bacterium]
MPLLDKNDKKTTIIASGIFVVTIMIVFYSLVYKPISSKIVETRENKNAKNAQLQEALAIGQQLGQLERDIRNLEYKLRESSKRLPQEKEIPDLLRHITTLGNKTKVDFIYFRPQNVNPKGFYNEVPIQVNVRGTYHNLGMFMAEVGKLERIVNTSAVQVQPLSGQKGESITSSFLITTFTFAKGGGF